MIKLILKLGTKYKFIGKFLHNFVNAYQKKHLPLVESEKQKTIELCKKDIAHVMKLEKHGHANKLNIYYQERG